MLYLIALILAIFIWIPAVIIFDGYTISTLWNWFMPAIFPSLPLLTTIQAITISLVIAALLPSPSYPDVEEDSTYKQVATIVKPFFRSGTLLLLGYIIKTYFMNNL